LKKNKQEAAAQQSAAVVLKRGNTGRKFNAAHVACVEEEQDGVEYGL
jgi:hypothetical protein